MGGDCCPYKIRTTIALVLRVWAIDDAIADVLGANATLVAAVDLALLAARTVALILLIHAVQMAIAHILLGQAAIRVALEAIALGIRRGYHNFTHLIQAHTILSAGKVLEELAVQILRQAQPKDIKEEAAATHRLRAERLTGRHGSPVEGRLLDKDRTPQQRAGLKGFNQCSRLENLELKTLCAHQFWLKAYPQVLINNLLWQAQNI